MIGRLTQFVLSGLFLAGCIFAPAAGQRFNHNSYLGGKPPELVSKHEHWLGGQEKVMLGDLEGKVVWLQFNF